MRRGKALSLWKVFVLIFVGLISITGITVLVLYFMGEFDEKHIEPNDMFFVETLNDGDGYYDSVLGRYEVSSNFSMTISTSTEDVTETKVTLSLKNGESVGNDYITDGKIKVSKVVELNKPFEIVLQQEYNSNILEDWVVGGASTLTAKSENKLLLAKTVQIDVDVPIKDIDIKISGLQQTDSVQEIVVGSTFTIETIFTPANSKYLFSDSARNKEIFYANTSSYISYDWDNEKFVADTRSGNATDTITVYTFLNSYYQKQIMDKFKDVTDRELLTSSVLREFERLQKEEQKTAFISKTIYVKVLDIDVDMVSVDSANKSFDTYLDKYYILSANSNNGNANLGISIKDSKGGSLGTLMGNVGIKVSKEAEDFLIEGQEIMKVDTSQGETIITRETYNSKTNYAEARNGIEYYVLPYTSPKDYNDYYWQISSSSVYDEIELKINFFYENEEGLWEAFFNISGTENLEKQIKIRIEKHDYEEDPAWITNDTITMTINYDENGLAKPISRDLSKDINEINSDNIYKTVKYFIFIDQNDSPAVIDDMQEVFSVKQGITYKNNYNGDLIEIAGTKTPTGGYVLYELNEEFILTAMKSFSGKVKVVVATVRTYANNKVVKNADGSYQIVKTSRAKDILVESTLSIANMIPTFSFATGITPNKDDNKYYIPAVNRNESGSQKTMVTLNFTLENSDDTETDEKKVLNAFNTKDLKIVCLDASGQEINDYVSWQGLTKKEVVGNKIVFEGELAIEEGFFSAGKTSVDQGTYIKLQLQYNNGKEVYKKTVTFDDDDSIDSFYIYYQQPVEMKATFDEKKTELGLDKDGDGNLDDIEVNISATEGIKIAWGNYDVPGDTTEDVLNNLNNLLTFTLIDQYGKEIETSSEIYKVRFVEEFTEGETKSYLSFDSTLTELKNFISTQGENKTTALRIYVVDKEDKNVYMVDDSGMLTSELMASTKLLFQLSSEGVTKVEYDKKDVVIVEEDEPEYVEGDVSTVTVKKYVTSEDIIVLNSLIKVYLSNSVEATDNIQFKLDKDYVSSLSTSNRKDIMKMLTFNDEAVAAIDVEPQPDSIDNYLDEEISKLKIINPFKEDTEIVFSVRDKSEVLYDITLVLVLKSDISITQSFNLYYAKYSKYLVQNGNQIGVFANEKYDLSEYITLNSHLGKTYSWVGLFSKYDIENFFFSQDTVCHAITEGEGDAKKAYFTIDPIYQFKSLSFTLYYGVKSFYSCSTTITLYVNPNILIKQTAKSVKLEDVATSTTDLSKNYEFYVLTDYLKDGSGELILGEFGFENVENEENKYLTINEDNGKFKYGFKEKTLSLKLGEKIEQSFKFVKNLGQGTSETVDAVLILEDENIVLCKDSGDLRISIEIGYETNAEGVLIDADKNPVKTVQYENETYLLLTVDTTYKTDNDFVLVTDSAKGQVHITSGLLKTRNPDGFVSLTGNSFKVQKTLSADKSLTVEVSLKAIVSKVGEKFVYYAESLPDSVDEMEYNTYGDVDLSDIIGDYTKLEQNNVFQSLKAGEEYTIIHNTKEGVSLNDAFGFYYDGKSTQINVEGPSAAYRISVVSEATGYIDGLASIDGNKLVINNLETSYEQAYIVLRFECYQYLGGVNFAWYYRIKVEPNFTVGKITYPYSEVGEYLDIYSNYYNGSEYVIDLEETYTAQTSIYIGEKRFADISWVTGVEQKVTTAQYTIKSATVDGLEISNYRDYFTYSFDSGKLTISLIDSTTKLSIMIEKSLYVGDTKMIGSEMQYLLIFNQGATYVPTVKMNGETLTHTNYRYNATVTAGSGEVTFETSIKVSSNGTESKVSDYNATIFGNYLDLMNGLLYKKMVVSGVKYYEKLEDGTYKEVGVLTEALVFGEWKNFVACANEITSYNDYVELENVIENGKTYYVKSCADNFVSNITCVPVYLDVNKTLHLKPASSIEKDYFFEIDFCTDERVAFRINLTVTSYFDWSIKETEFKGGEKYTYNAGDNKIFEKISSDKTTISGLKIELKEDKVYSYKATQDSSIVAGKTYYKLEKGDYVVVKNPEVNKLNTYYEEDLKYSDLILITDGSPWKNGTIEFAHLTKTTTFEFKATIKDTNGSYTFGFELTVLKSFDTSETRRYVDTVDRYGSLEFEVQNETIIASASAKLPKLDGGKTNYKFDDDKTSITITPDNVATKTTIQNTYTMYCVFKNKNIFSFEITYRYTTNPNVSVEANYPSPDGKTNLQKEYISTSEKISESFEDFFTTNAYFGTKNRITTQNLAKDKDGNNIDVSQKWIISISSISNAIVYVSGSSSKTIGVESSDKIVVADADSVSRIGVKFEIVNTASSGLVTFDVTVNAVTTTYTVEIVSGSIITVSTNTPNYANNRETIYAEDLATQEDGYLFTQARILNYALKTEVEVGTNYYLRYENETKEVEVLTITANALGTIINQDLGKSYKGYNYKGTFDSKTAAESGAEDRKYVDDQIYLSAPKLTERVVAYYYDGTQIAFDDENVTLIYSNGNEKASEFQLTNTNYNQEVTLSFALAVNGKKIKTSGNYNLYLDIEFTVTGNADSSSSYTTVDIKAGETKRLLSYSEFGIKNARTGLLYDPDSVYASSGTITLEIYGFEGAPQVNKESSDTLEVAAGEIHNNLANNETEDGIKYSTGLTPRVLVGEEKINEISSGDLKKSYITISGVINNKKSVDYAITAQGANNDGNHVMMRITYKVEIGGELITKQHNILFRVIPNSTVKFKNNYDDSQIYNTSSNEIIGYQTVASNHASPYEIVFTSSDNKKFCLWNNNNPSDEDASTISTILANMYGSSTNSASSFTYSAPSDKPVGYNEVEPSLEEDESTGVFTGVVTVSDPKLGSKYFVIDAENDFGFKMRFYYQTTADLTPQIASADNVYTEGETVGFGAMYNLMEPVTNSDGYAVYSPFKIVEYGSSQIANYIKVDLSDSINNQIESAKVEITLSNDIVVGGETIKSGKIISRDVTSGVASGVNFITGDWTVGDGTDPVIEIADGGKVLVGQSCIFMLKVKVVESKTPETIGTYTATYVNGNQEGNGDPLILTQQHTVSSSLVSPKFNTKEGITGPQHEIVLAGMPAYGYATSLVAVDKNALQISKFQDVKVSKIELYLGETCIGTTTTKDPVSLVTDPAISFVKSSDSISPGEAYSGDSMAFAIPTIDGFYFGTSNKLNNVKMRITLETGEGSDKSSCVLTKNITLQRAASSEGLFTSTTIADANSIAVATGKTVYNDTLEVVLKQGESIKLQLSNKNDFANAKTVELSNNKPYTITEYVGISRNITGLTTNLKAGNTIYVNILEKEGNPVLNYNGSEVSSTALTIAQYENEITLNIENVDELDSSNQKAETLYFLFVDNEKVYQHVETFTVTPQKKSAKHSEEEDNYFKVENFMKASYGTTNSYYILTLEDWASKINLIDYSGGSEQTLTVANAYKYYFEINTSDGESSGSAFVDENGMITTTEDFNILSHTISVNVYMKVSGQDGQFEVANQRLLLGTFTLYLDSSQKTETEVGITNNLGLVDGNIISLPTNYSLYSTKDKNRTIATIDSGSLENNPIFAVEVGEEFEFDKLYSSLEGTNKAYHLVGYKKDSGVYTAVNFDNVDNWTFDTAGTYEITCVLHAKDEDAKDKWTKYTSKIIAYETSTKEEKNISLQIDETTKTATCNLDSNYTWYEIGENGKVTSVEKYEASNLGVYTKKYIAKNENSTKIVTNNYYVYKNIEKVEVATVSEFAYSLKNLVGTLDSSQTVEFYKIVNGEFVKCSTDSTITETTAQYVACIKTKDKAGEWKVTKVRYFEVTYKIVSQTITELTMYIEKETNLIDTAQKGIKEALEQLTGTTINGYITIKTIDSSNILSEEVSKAENKVETKTYFATYNGRNYRFRITFCAYESEKEITYNFEANNAFSLSTMDSKVRDEVDAEDGVVAYYRLNNNTLTQVSTISLENDCKEEFYVMVGETYYLIKFNFVLNAIGE